MSRMTKGERQSGGSRFIGDIEPQKSEWVGLTDDEKAYSNTNYLGKSAEAWHGGVAWAEAKLREKNGG